MANISSGFCKYHVFQGPAIVYLGPEGATPSAIGGVFNVSIEFGIEVERLEQGWPRILQELYIKRKTAKVSFDTCEPGDYETFQYALGSAGMDGPASLPGGERTATIWYGEQTTVNKCSIKLEIVNTESVTEEVYIWKALASEGFSKAYEDEDLHKPTYTFEVLRATEDWASADLTSDHGELMKLVVTGNNIMPV